MKSTKQKRVPFFAPVMGKRRATLNRIRSRARKFGFSPSAVRPQTLLLYAKLENNKSGLSWRLSEETKGHPAEIRLEKSDAFYLDKIALGLHKVLILNGEEAPANSPIIHYPDANWLVGADVARDCEGIYNSRLRMQTDQDVRLENFWTGDLRHVPEQQYQPSATDPLTFQYSTDPYFDLESNFGLWGNKRNEISLTYGQGVYGAIAGQPTAGTDPYQNYGVIMLQGFLIVRGAEALTLSDANQLFAGL